MVYHFRPSPLHFIFSVLKGYYKSFATAVNWLDIVHGWYNLRMLLVAG
jgi:hypothetical protein